MTLGKLPAYVPKGRQIIQISCKIQSKLVMPGSNLQINNHRLIPIYLVVGIRADNNVRKDKTKYILISTYHNLLSYRWSILGRIILSRFKNVGSKFLGAV